jgi:hypothetical protein
MLARAGVAVSRALTAIRTPVALVAPRGAAGRLVTASHARTHNRASSVALAGLDVSLPGGRGPAGRVATTACHWLHGVSFTTTSRESDSCGPADEAEKHDAENKRDEAEDMRDVATAMRDMAEKKRDQAKARPRRSATRPRRSATRPRRSAARRRIFLDAAVTWQEHRSLPNGSSTTCS